MSRIRQINSSYQSADRIKAEFENIVRYLQAAEHGDYTIGELLNVLFNEDTGVWDGPIDFRYDASVGLQVRIGTYTDETTGWSTLATAAELRGAAGRDIGDIGQPVVYGRTAFTATASQTVFSITMESTDIPLVWVDGLLQAQSEYTASAVADTITFDSAMSGGEIVEVALIRGAENSAYRRTDFVASASQAVFPFVHTDAETLYVYQNGLLLREGGANDYTTSPSSNTITLTSAASASDVISVVVTNTTALTTVAGIMLEDNYTNGSGLIPYAKLSIADNDIPQAKINGLTTLLANRGRMYVSGSTPSTPAAGDLWLDTSTSPNTAKIYNGVSWLPLNLEVDIPDYTTSNASQFLQVNGTGTAIQWANVDLSTLVPKSYMAAANGVATLDASGLIPIAQLPSIFALRSYDHDVAGSVSNSNQKMQRIYGQKVRIDAISHKTSAGTCTVQLTVDGTPVGTTHSVSSTRSEYALGASIEVDATAASKEIGYVITSASSAADLNVTISTAVLTA